MVKGIKKTNKTPTNTINSILPENNTSPKSKQQIDKEYYQKNKEHKKNNAKKDISNKKHRSN